MTELLHELTAAFVEDTTPLVDDFAEAVLALERALRDGHAWDEILRLLRARLHTIKGNAGMVGQARIVELSHALEDACALGSLDASRRAEWVDLLLQGADLLAALMAARGQGHERALAALKEQIASLGGGGDDVPTLEPPTAEQGDEASAVASRPLLRMDLATLDRLLDGLGEAISEQVALSGQSRSRAAGLDPVLEERVHRLGSTLRELRELLVRARLVSMASLFGRFVRPIRDLARERGLEVELRHSGGEHGIDKAISDQLAEPLLHLVRNAVAHGIESAAERVRLGKRPTGTISLTARADGDRTLITVSDDGRGLDVARLRERARSLGVESAGLSDEQCLRLAFLPRLSTAAQVDELSGRGVGLDAAEHALKALGGSLSVSSRPGQGARFVLELPSSLSLLKGLVVRLGQERFVLPVSSVVQTFRLEPDMLHEVNGRRVVRWKQLVPWLDLAALLEVERAPEAEGYAALVHTGTSVRAVGVDAVLGAVEAIVKPLESGLTRLSCLTGAALLGDGGVALILNPRGLHEQAGREDGVGARHG